MTLIRYTLLTDGSSDSVLMPIIEWLIREIRPDIGVLGQLAEGLSTTNLSLTQRIPAAIRNYPCDLLFIHRDGEGEKLECRLAEIASAMDGSGINYVPIIPIKMTEAWLFSDEAAIRSAAENRNGNMALDLPTKRQWEIEPDPKKLLFKILRIASGKHGRALDKFYPHRQRHLISQRARSFAQLRGLPSFDFFEMQLTERLRGF